MPERRGELNHDILGLWKKATAFLSSFLLSCLRPDPPIALHYQDAEQGWKRADLTLSILNGFYGQQTCGISFSTFSGVFFSLTMSLILDKCLSTHKSNFCVFFSESLWKQWYFFIWEESWCYTCEYFLLSQNNLLTGYWDLCFFYFRKTKKKNCSSLPVNTLLPSQKNYLARKTSSKVLCRFCVISENENTTINLNEKTNTHKQ